MDVAGIRSFNELSAAVRAQNSQELGKNQFLELMITQLKHQDPLNPAQNEDFIAQLAQFSSLEGIENLNKSVDSMATAMRATVTMERPRWSVARCWCRRTAPSCRARAW